jgi:hypothetical protein
MKETEMERRVREAESEVERVREGVGQIILAYARFVDQKVIELERSVEASRRLVAERDAEIRRLNQHLARYRRDHVLATDLAAVTA